MPLSLLRLFNMLKSILIDQIPIALFLHLLQLNSLLFMDPHRRGKIIICLICMALTLKMFVDALHII